MFKTISSHMANAGKWVSRAARKLPTTLGSTFGLSARGTSYLRRGLGGTGLALGALGTGYGAYSLAKGAYNMSPTQAGKGFAIGSGIAALGGFMGYGGVRGFMRGRSSAGRMMNNMRSYFKANKSAYKFRARSKAFGFRGRR